MPNSTSARVLHILKEFPYEATDFTFLDSEEQISTLHPMADPPMIQKQLKPASGNSEGISAHPYLRKKMKV